LNEKRNSISAAGTQLAFVHMSDEETAKPFFERYGLDDLPRISDPDCVLYRVFGLEKLRAIDFVRPSFLWRTFQSSVLKRRGVGSLGGDQSQLPGAFLIHQGKILRSHVYQQPWEHPDFGEMAGLPGHEVG
jgi:hypothetical protein